MVKNIGFKEKYFNDLKKPVGYLVISLYSAGLSDISNSGKRLFESPAR